MTRRHTVLAVLGVLILLTGYSVWIEPQWLQISRHRIVAKVQTPVRMVHLSDLHFAKFERVHSQILNEIALLKPDIIFITGDIVSPNTQYEDLERFLKGMHAVLGVYAIQGNWEHWIDNRYNEILLRSGVVDITNRRQICSAGLELVGFDYPDVSRKLLSEESPQTDFRIALSHTPQAFDVISKHFDLVLSGHTHGGQINVPFWGPLWLPEGSGRYLKGWYTSGASKMYVNRGVGMSLLPIRFLARPEMAVIDLEPNK